jgi:hypothetical protein
MRPKKVLLGSYYSFAKYQIYLSVRIIIPIDTKECDVHVMFHYIFKFNEMNGLATIVLELNRAGGLFTQTLLFQHAFRKDKVREGYQMLATQDESLITLNLCGRLRGTLSR